jgi:hypothetical protein
MAREKPSGKPLPDHEQKGNNDYWADMLVSDLIRMGPEAGVRVMCRLCGHRGFFKGIEAALVFGEEATLEAIPSRTKCKGCGHKRARFFAVAVMDQHRAMRPYLAFAGTDQHARCHMCWHEETLSVPEALSRYGAEATYENVRTDGRCSKCGTKGYLRTSVPVRGVYTGG